MEPSLTITDALAGQTLAAILRQLLPGESWAQVRQKVTARRAEIDDALCLDPARRVKAGEIVRLRNKPAPARPGSSREDLTIRHLDDHIVVLEKASGINTVRHPAERDWQDPRRALEPTLEDLAQWAIAARKKVPSSTLPRLRTVQRLDKDTSGLVVFARNADAERNLGGQFRSHTVTRRYLAVVPGFIKDQTLESWLVRDRGDGRRGSGAEGEGKLAVTHLEIGEKLPRHTIVRCRLETGRTHQIRIHLAEAGHPVCGDKVYRRGFGTPLLPDPDEAPRLALHALELGFTHPATGEPVHWEMPLPVELLGFVNRLRGKPG